MNDSLQDQLDRLTIELRKRRRRYRNSLRNVIFFSVIVLIFFSLYSVLIGYKVREIATPSTIALLIADQLREQYAAELNTNRADFRQTAEDMSQSVLLALPLAIHAGGELLKESMASEAYSAALNLSLNLSPILHRNADRIFSSAGIPAEEISSLTGNPEIIRLIENEKTLMFPVPWSLGRRLREIRLKKTALLSRQDLCDRDFMLCWLYLCENERYRDCRSAGFLTAVSSSILQIWQEETDRTASGAQKNTKNIPVQNKIPAMQ